VLGSVGDYFGEFMAGGIAVICGHDAQTPDNVLGYRPLVGMVGGKVFFRGPHKGYSQNRCQMLPIDDEDWQWLQGTCGFSGADRADRSAGNADRAGAVATAGARTPRRKWGSKDKRSMAAFRQGGLGQGTGRGGIIGDLSDLDRSQIPV
jgi:hypothetical protein